MVLTARIYTPDDDIRPVSVGGVGFKEVKKDMKGLPSIDVELAQHYKAREDLPPIEQGVDPETETTDGMDNIETELVQLILDDGTTESSKPRSSLPPTKSPAVNTKEVARPRRVIRCTEDVGRSCLRCREKGLRCTLNYIGKESEPQCAACRRSRAEYCVSIRPKNERRRVGPFFGPPWLNPDFVGSTAKGVAALPHQQLQEIIRQHYAGEPGYVMGHYLCASDVQSFALPSYSGAGFSELDRADNSWNVTWKDILPTRLHRTLLLPTDG
ncbi:hypothetical protein GGS20DRAFT_130109 [Poronia punctata]|nr:hypothetical protein GGS20DRAFT_130109 [Poronia punctata]